MPSTSSTRARSPRASSPAPGRTCTRQSSAASARYASEDAAEEDIRRRVASKEVIIGFGHAVYTIADPRNAVIKEVAKRLAEQAGDMLTWTVADRIESTMAELKGR